MQNILFNKNTIFVLMLIIPLILLLLCNYKTCSLSNIEHFGVDDNSIKNIFKKLFGLNKTEIKNNVVSDLDNNINQLGNITNSIKNINGDETDSENVSGTSSSDNVSGTSSSDNVSGSDSVSGTSGSDSVSGTSSSDSVSGTSGFNNVNGVNNIGYGDNNEGNKEEVIKGNQNNKDINNVVSTNILKGLSKAKPKELPLLNKVGGLQKINNNIIKGDFQKKSEKCKFFGGKCPNGYTRFGTFQVINNAILNGEKLVCDNSISKNNESCAYCCKQ